MEPDLYIPVRAWYDIHAIEYAAEPHVHGSHAIHH